MDTGHQAIKIASQMTGLSAHVIRIWEKRYGAVEPVRTGTNRRLYSKEQIERLNLLREVTQGGHTIGLVAKVPTDQLRQMARESRGTKGPIASAETTSPRSPTLLEECLAAVKSLDGGALDDALKRGETKLGALGFLQRVVAPLAQTIGELWRNGTITGAHEHFATAIIRDYLSRAARPFGETEHAPRLLVTTPAGQVHELGALLVGATAAQLGWNVTYLGPSLPAAEIAGAALQKQARAVALSLVYPEDDPRLGGELALLREFLPPEIALVVGGRAMPGYRDILERIKAHRVSHLSDLGAILDDLRNPTKKPRR